MSDYNDKIQAEIDLNTAIAQQQFGNRFDEDEKMVRRHPDTGRIVFPRDMAEDQLQVTFSTQQVLNKRLSYEAGKDVYVPMEFVTIRTPGARDFTHAPVTDYHQWRFPVDYANFKRGQDGSMAGTPIEEWSAVSPTQVQELKHQNIYTVEQIAQLSDSVNGVIRGFYHLKGQAKQFLEGKKDVAVKAEIDKALEEREAKHKAEMAALKAEMAAMLAEAMGKGKGSPAAK